MTDFEIMEDARKGNPHWNGEREDDLDITYYAGVAPPQYGHNVPFELRGIPAVMRYICGIYDIPHSIIFGLNPELVKKANSHYKDSIMNFEGWIPSFLDVLVHPCLDYIQLREQVRNCRKIMDELVNEVLDVYTIVGDYLKKYDWEGWNREYLKPYKRGGIEDYKM